MGVKIEFLKGILILLALLFCFAANISTGSVSIPLTEILEAIVSPSQSPELIANIIWQLRIPKALTCILAGASLSIGGLLMQTMFRNPLAGPDVLGLSSGASLLVALALLLGTTSSEYLPIINPWSLAVSASLGSGLVFLLIIGVANRVKSNTSLLIIGLMIAAVAGSLVGVLQYMSSAQNLQAFVLWTLGSVGGTNWSELLVMSLLLGVGMVVSYGMVKNLNAWLIGDNYASSLGIDLQRSRIIIVMVTCALVGGVTAFCGPIAFVGLAVPHLIRLLVPTTNHKILLPMVMAGGALLMLICDIVAQLPGSSKTLPLNAITSIVGAPVVIWVVLRSRGIRM